MRHARGQTAERVVASSKKVQSAEAPTATAAAVFIPVATARSGPPPLIARTATARASHTPVAATPLAARLATLSNSKMHGKRGT
jgi:hypothetical protein